MSSLSEPRFHDEDAAREHIETSRWADGIVCPFCGSMNVHRMAGKTQAGYFLCNDCRDKFTCRTGTVMERSHIPLHKWLLAIHLMASNKNGVSALELMRNLGIGSYRTAWFLAHRIREAMTGETVPTGGLGGEGKIVEADEAYIGGSKKNRAHSEPAPKKADVTLIERGGASKSFHVADVTAKTLRTVITTHASRKSTLMTDESGSYIKVGREFAKHRSVDHTRDEYAYTEPRTGLVVSINVSENFFSILKRGIDGTYHSVSEAHLGRYLGEFDFRYSNRIKLGVDDAMRAAKILKGVEGKRLAYDQPAIH